MRSRSLEISRSLSDQSTFMNYFLSSRSEVQAGVSKNELAHFEIYRYELIWLVTYFLIQSNAHDIHLSQSRFLPRKARTGEQFWPFLAKPAIGQNSDFDQSWRSKTIFWPMATLKNGPATDPISLTLLWPSKLTLFLLARANKTQVINFETPLLSWKQAQLVSVSKSEFKERRTLPNIWALILTHGSPN